MAIRKAVWPTTATDSAASDAATIAVPAAPSIRPKDTARASGTASTR